VGNALASQRAAQRCHDTFVAEKFRKGHDQPCSTLANKGLTADKMSAEISSGSRISPRVAS